MRQDDSEPIFPPASTCPGVVGTGDVRGRRRLVGGALLSVLAGGLPRRLLAQPASSAAPSATAPASAATKMPLGLIGAGRIGGTLGALWVQAGHPVMFSSRDPKEGEALVGRLGPLARAGSVADAIGFGDALFFAVPYAALPELGREHAAALKGKVALDACNAVASRDGPIADEANRDGVGLTSQKLLAGTRLVRAFNTISYTILAREANRAVPRLPIPIAGDNAEAVRIAALLVGDAGFEPVLAGSLADARRFQMGGPGYGPAADAAELKRRLSLAP